MSTSADATTPAATSVIESRTIEPVPDAERTGKASSQFTLWLGANLQITAIVDGSLAVIFGADPIWAIVGLLIGNVLGGIVTALHAAQGPRLGLPQMISSRAQFGVFGAVLPLILVVIMYLGFAATGTVLSGQAINRAFHVQTPAFGIIIFGVLTAVVAILGYNWIHKLGRVASVAGMLMLAYLAVRVFMKYDVGAMFSNNHFGWVGFLLAIALGAGWQLTYGPYVADYSRYLPRHTSEASVFGWTLAGLVVGSQLSMSFGVLLGALPLPKGQNFMSNQVGFMGALGGGGLIALAIYLIIVIGKLTVNTLNAYGGCMTILTTASAFTKRKAFTQRGRSFIIVAFILVSLLVALLASADFLNYFKNFVLLLLTFFTPWSAINLVDYYVISRERVDIPALYDAGGRYGRWNVPALLTYAIGVLVQIPFLSTTLYTGPIAERMGGADISWILGLAIPAALYAVWGRRTARPPERTILMPDPAERAA